MSRWGKSASFSILSHTPYTLSMFELFKNSTYGANALKAAEAGDCWTAAALMTEFIDGSSQIDVQQAVEWLHNALPEEAV